MDNIESELLILDKYKLTAEEWLVIRLLLLASADENHPEYLAKYLMMSHTNLLDVLISLQNKSVILKSCKFEKGRKFDPDDVTMNKNFLKDFYKCSGIMGEELFLEYPYSMDAGGRTYILNNITKGYNSLEDLYFDYGRIIKFNPQTHKEVMEMLKFAKQYKLITFGICEWIKSHKWLTIKKMKEDGSYMEKTFDTVISV